MQWVNVHGSNCICSNNSEFYRFLAFPLPHKLPCRNWNGCHSTSGWAFWNAEKTEKLSNVWTLAHAGKHKIVIYFDFHANGSFLVVVGHVRIHFLLNNSFVHFRDMKIQLKETNNNLTMTKNVQHLARLDMFVILVYCH